MPIPVFVSQVVASATDTVQSGGGTIINIPTSYFYYYYGSGHAAANGCSLLYQLVTSLNLSSGTTWTAVLDSNLKLKISHNSGSTVNMVLNRGLAWNLGFAKVFSTTYPPDVTLTETIAVPAGASGYTAEYRSPWLWCPEMLISSVGPELFDPAIQFGIRSSAGSTSRAPDGSAAYTSNGIQYDASFSFKGVQYLYRARQPNLNYQSDGHEREDYETWWQYGPRLGRRFLLWRNKATLMNGASWALGGGSAPAPNYVEYNPSEEMRMRPLCVATAPPNLTYWDITVSGFTTPNVDGFY